MKIKPIVMITGASSGIGLETARIFTQNGCDLIVTARRSEKLKNLANELETSCHIQCLPLVFDVQNKTEVFEAIAGLDKSWQNISILINNAGLALGLNNVDEGNTDDWDIMLDTNIKGLLYVSKAVISLMKERNKGHIINIGSIAGKEIYPKGNVYCASKHAVDALTKAMRVDLLPYGIRVTQVCPGATETEFSEVRFKGDVNKANKVYAGFQPLTGKDIAEVILFCAERPPHVNINDILVMPYAQANSSVTLKEER